MDYRWHHYKREPAKWWKQGEFRTSVPGHSGKSAHDDWLGRFQIQGPTIQHCSRIPAGLE
jgi:hypothetical protein